MSDDELLKHAYSSTHEAALGLKIIFDLGHGAPVPADDFSAVLRRLQAATSSVQALERRARGAPAPKKD